MKDEKSRTELIKLGRVLLVKLQVQVRDYVWQLAHGQQVQMHQFRPFPSGKQKRPGEQHPSGQKAAQAFCSLGLKQHQRRPLQLLPAFKTASPCGSFSFLSPPASTLTTEPTGQGSFSFLNQSVPNLPQCELKSLNTDIILALFVPERASQRAIRI